MLDSIVIFIDLSFRKQTPTMLAEHGIEWSSKRDLFSVFLFSSLFIFLSVASFRLRFVCLCVCDVYNIILQFAMFWIENHQEKEWMLSPLQLLLLVSFWEKIHFLNFAVVRSAKALANDEMWEFAYSVCECVWCDCSHCNCVINGESVEWCMSVEHEWLPETREQWQK